MIHDTKFFFIRKEKKYFIDKSTYEKLKFEIASHLMQEEFKESGTISFVKSIYLDNYQWKTYYDHKRREKQRFKLRIRQYGFNKEKCFVELKEKRNKITFKSRFKIKTEWNDDFLDEINILPRLR